MGFVGLVVSSCFVSGDYGGGGVLKKVMVKGGRGVSTSLLLSVVGGWGKEAYALLHLHFSFTSYLQGGV